MSDIKKHLIIQVCHEYRKGDKVWLRKLNPYHTNSKKYISLIING